MQVNVVTEHIHLLV